MAAIDDAEPGWPPTAAELGLPESCAEAPLRSLQQALHAAASSAKPQVFTRSVPPFEITHVNPAWVALCGFEELPAQLATGGEVLALVQENRLVAKSKESILQWARI